MTAEPLPAHDQVDVDELDERRRLEAEVRAAELAETGRPALEHPLPDGVSDTFTFTCPCEATVHVVGGVEQPHDCPLTDAQKQALRDLAAAEVDDQADDDQAAGADQPAQIDVLDLAQLILVGANNRLGERSAPPVEKQIALGQALATLELARWTRAQYALNQQMAGLAMQQAAQQQAVARGPAGIVVPHLAPSRRG